MRGVRSALVVATALGALLAGGDMGAWAQSQPAKPRVLGYPGGAGGQPTPLGIGWDSQRVSATSSVCIIFQEATSQDSDAVYSNRTVVSDKFSHSQALNVSADVSVKSISGASVDAKASYSSQTEISGSELTIVDHVTVDRGVRYAAPVSIGNTAQYTQQVHAQPSNARNPGQVQRAMNIDPQAVHAQYARYFVNVASPHNATQRARSTALALALQQINEDAKKAGGATSAAPGAGPSLLPPPSNAPRGAMVAGAAASSGSSSVRLTDDMARLAATNPTAFRQQCGDGYVGSISQGGELAVTYKIRTSSAQSQQDIAASLGVGYSGGVASGSANVSVSSTLKNMKEDGNTSITTFRSGGSGQPVPTKLEDIDPMVAGFPAAVQAAPRNYLITVIDYRTLPNYSSSSGMQEITGVELLAWEYGKAAAVYTSATDILANNQTYLSGGEANYLFARSGDVSSVRTSQGTASARLAAIRTVAAACVNGGSCTVSGTFDEFSLRATFPLPIMSGNMGSVARALWSPDAAYRAAVSAQWLDGPNEMRCDIRPGDPNFCADDSTLQVARSKIPVAPGSGILFMLEKADAPGQCMNAALNSYFRLGPCPTMGSNPDFLFRYDLATGLLYPQAWKDQPTVAVMVGREVGKVTQGYGWVGSLHMNSVVNGWELGQSWDFRADQDNTKMYMVVRADAPNQAYSTLAGACVGSTTDSITWVNPCPEGAIPLRLRGILRQ